MLKPLPLFTAFKRRSKGHLIEKVLKRDCIIAGQNEAALLECFFEGFIEFLMGSKKIDEASPSRSDQKISIFFDFAKANYLLVAVNLTSVRAAS